MFKTRRFHRDLAALGLLAATVFVGLSLLSFDLCDPPSRLIFPTRQTPLNICGTLGAHIAYKLRSLVGFCCYFVLFSMALLDVRLFSDRKSKRPCFECAGWLLLLTSLCVLFQRWLSRIGSGQVFGNGGYVGAMGTTLLEDQFTNTGTLILVSTGILAGLLLTCELQFLRVAMFCSRLAVRTLKRIAFGKSDSAVRAAHLNDSRRQRHNNLPQAPEEDTHNSDLLEENELPTEDAGATRRQQSIKVNPPVTAKTAREQVIERLDANIRQTEINNYDLPDCDLLDEPGEFPYEILAKKARLAAVTLEKTFEEFGLNVHVVEIDTGPVITQFELELEPGLKLSKVTSLADDLAIALRVPAVRVVASIPGKNTVGVEVPNEKQVKVHLRELIESCPQDSEGKHIPVFLGKNVSGHPMVVDLTQMPHLLIAGRTGTGKSVCLNALILSILMTRSPDQVRMLMIDPKMVELSPYKRIPHLMHPVITDMKKAEAVLAWAVDKMEERYDLLARSGVRHLEAFNLLGKEQVLQRCGIDPDSPEADSVPDQMPYIVIVADEMADMMMTSGKDVEGHIIRLAQKSRAVGLHLVLATQKPTVDVITGLIKSNLPARISFQVASRSDSRVVLDEMGADRLLGNGDMLYLAPGTSHLARGQGAFVSDEEVTNVIDFFSDQDPQFSEELAQLSTASSRGNNDLDAERQTDKLYNQAIEIVIREGRGSVSLLQRCLGIGYGRAARLIDYMAEDGVVGDYNGSQAREVNYTMEQWEAIQTGCELETSSA